jgi:hypothetical protein
LLAKIPETLDGKRNNAVAVAVVVVVVPQTFNRI